MRGLRASSVAALMFMLLVRLAADPVVVSSVLVTGAFRTGESALRSMLFFREGSVYEDREALDKAVEFSRARMEQTREYTYIDIYSDVGDDGNAEITVSVSESFASPVGSLVLFPNLPFYGASLGFLVSDTVQAAAVGVLLPFPWDLVFTLGNRIMGPADGLTAGVAAEWTPTPEIGFTLTQEASHALTNDHDVDLTSGIGVSLDCSWLANVMGAGFALSVRARKGWYEYDFASIQATVEAVVKPVKLLSLTGSVDVYSSWGDYPPYGGAPSLRAARFESAPCQCGDGPSEVSYKLEALFGELFRITFIPLSPGVSLFGFAAAGSVLPDASSFDWSSCPLAAGGGVQISFPSPVSISLRAGWSYAIAENRGAFSIGVE